MKYYTDKVYREYLKPLDRDIMKCTWNGVKYQVKR